MPLEQEQEQELEQDLELFDVLREGEPRYGRIWGTLLERLELLCPITAAEWAYVLKSTVRMWAGVCTVIERRRLASRRRPVDTVRRQDALRPPSPSEKATALKEIRRILSCLEGSPPEEV